MTAGVSQDMIDVRLADRRDQWPGRKDPETQPLAIAQTAFGITFSSSRRFAELVNTEDKPRHAPTVAIEWGEVSGGLKNPTLRRDWWQTTATDYLLQVPGVARFHVTAHRIIVSPEPGADDAAVRLYLFGSVMGALLHLRGVLPLHGSAVSLPDGKGAAIFTGTSSAGKSSLAAALSRRGYPLMADDIAAVGIQDGRCVIHPGLARSKLWRESLDFLGFDRVNGSAVRPGKYAFDVPVMRRSATVTHVYELVSDEAGGVAIAKVVGLQKLRLLDRQTFRRNYVGGFGRRGEHLQRLMQLAGQVHAGRINRPQHGPVSIDAIIGLLERDWAQ